MASPFRPVRRRWHGEDVVFTGNLHVLIAVTLMQMAGSTSRNIFNPKIDGSPGSPPRQIPATV